VAPSKMHGRKTQEWKTRHEMTWVENAGVEKVARSDTGGKRGSNQQRTLRKCNEASQAGPPRKMYEQRMSHPAVDE